MNSNFNEKQAITHTVQVSHTHTHTRTQWGSSKSHSRHICLSCGK